LFECEPSGVLFTKEILKELHARHDRPWSEWKAGKPITATQLANQLKPFDIPANKTVRRGGDTDKGYRRQWFDNVFARYLSAFEAVTQSQVRGSETFCDPGAVKPGANVTEEGHEKPSISVQCDRVTDPQALLWRDRV
jgi:hypothetical protein